MGNEGDIPGTVDCRSDPDCGDVYRFDDKRIPSNCDRILVRGNDVNGWHVVHYDVVKLDQQTDVMSGVYQSDHDPVMAIARYGQGSPAPFMLIATFNCEAQSTPAYSPLWGAFFELLERNARDVFEARGYESLRDRDDAGAPKHFGDFDVVCLCLQEAGPANTMKASLEGWIGASHAVHECHTNPFLAAKYKVHCIVAVRRPRIDGSQTARLTFPEQPTCRQAYFGTNMLKRGLGSKGVAAIQIPGMYGFTASSAHLPIDTGDKETLGFKHRANSLAYIANNVLPRAGFSFVAGDLNFRKWKTSPTKFRDELTDLRLGTLKLQEPSSLRKNTCKLKKAPATADEIIALDPALFETLKFDDTLQGTLGRDLGTLEPDEKLDLLGTLKGRAGFEDTLRHFDPAFFTQRRQEPDAESAPLEDQQYEGGDVQIVDSAEPDNEFALPPDFHVTVRIEDATADLSGFLRGPVPAPVQRVLIDAFPQPDDYVQEIIENDDVAVAVLKVPDSEHRIIFATTTGDPDIVLEGFERTFVMDRFVAVCVALQNSDAASAQRVVDALQKNGFMSHRASTEADTTHCIFGARWEPRVSPYSETFEYGIEQTSLIVDDAYAFYSLDTKGARIDLTNIIEGSRGVRRIVMGGDFDPAALDEALHGKDMQELEWKVSRLPAEFLTRAGRESLGMNGRIRPSAFAGEVLSPEEAADPEGRAALARKRAMYDVEHVPEPAGRARPSPFAGEVLSPEEAADPEGRELARKRAMFDIEHVSEPAGKARPSAFAGEVLSPEEAADPEGRELARKRAMFDIEHVGSEGASLQSPVRELQSAFTDNVPDWIKNARPYDPVTDGPAYVQPTEPVQRLLVNTDDVVVEAHVMRHGGSLAAYVVKAPSVEYGDERHLYVTANCGGELKCVDDVLMTLVDTFKLHEFDSVYIGLQGCPADADADRLRAFMEHEPWLRAERAVDGVVQPVGGVAAFRHGAVLSCVALNATKTGMSVDEIRQRALPDVTYTNAATQGSYVAGVPGVVTTFGGDGDQVWNVDARDMRERNHLMMRLYDVDHALVVIGDFGDARDFDERLALLKGRHPEWRVAEHEGEYYGALPDAFLTDAAFHAAWDDVIDTEEAADDFADAVELPSAGSLIPAETYVADEPDSPPLKCDKQSGGRGTAAAAQTALALVTLACAVLASV